MEEILSSIRRVMSRDDDASVSAAHTDDAVLELTDADHEADANGADKFIVHVADEDSAGSPILRSKKSLKLDAAATETPAFPTLDESLVADPVAQVSRDKLSALSALIARPQESSTPDVAASGMTVDALVREAVRPLLKDWLDANLPEIVEAMVAREISRITGRNF